MTIFNFDLLGERDFAILENAAQVIINTEPDTPARIAGYAIANALLHCDYVHLIIFDLLGALQTERAKRDEADRRYQREPKTRSLGFFPDPHATELMDSLINKFTK